jgi:hypothetical protein
MLQQLPAEVVSKKGGPVRRVLAKAARSIQKLEVQKLNATLTDLNDQGEKDSTGLLAKNVVVTRGKAPTDGKGERYLVRIRRVTYPDRSGKPTTTLKTAQIKEYGSEKQEPEPFIRPAFNEGAPGAIALIERELPREIERIARKLAKERR